MPRNSDSSVLICTGMEGVNAEIATRCIKEGFGLVTVVKSFQFFHRALLALSPGLVILGPRWKMGEYIALIRKECGSKYKAYHPSMPEVMYVDRNRQIDK